MLGILIPLLLLSIRSQADSVGTVGKPPILYDIPSEDDWTTCRCDKTEGRVWKEVRMDFLNATMSPSGFPLDLQSGSSPHLLREICTNWGYLLSRDAKVLRKPEGNEEEFWLDEEGEETIPTGFHMPTDIYFRGSCSAGALVIAVSCAISAAEEAKRIKGLDREPEGKHSKQTMLTHAWHWVGAYLDRAERLLDFCVHCLSSMEWGVSYAEILHNYRTYNEDRSGGYFWRWQREDAKRTQGLHLLPRESYSDFVERARYEVYWARELRFEVSYWFLWGFYKTGEMQPDVEDYFVGGAPWWFPEDPCAYISKRFLSSGKALKILNSGSGPLPASWLQCDDVKARIFSADGLGRAYLELLGGMQPFGDPKYDEQKGWRYNLPVGPARHTWACNVEQLTDCYPENFFDLVTMVNALDHTFDPLRGIHQMLKVAKRGAKVLLRHAENEGAYNEFNFAESPSSPPSFVIWTPAISIDVTEELRDVATVRVHKYGRIPAYQAEKPQVWVDIQKL